jgi:hypothetical protein
VEEDAEIVLEAEKQPSLSVGLGGHRVRHFLFRENL